MTSAVTQPDIIRFTPRLGDVVEFPFDRQVEKGAIQR